MFKINEFNQRGPELGCHGARAPGSEVLPATTSGVGVSKSPRKTTTIYTRRKTKARTTKNPRRKWEKSDYTNALECLLRAEEKGVKKGIGKIVHDLWIEKGMWEIDEKKLNGPNKNDQVKRMGNKYRNRNNQEKNRKRR